MANSSWNMPNRTRRILEDLEAVRENLLALSDEIWQSIDRQHVDAFDEGVQLISSWTSASSSGERTAESRKFSHSCNWFSRPMPPGTDPSF